MSRKKRQKTTIKNGNKTEKTKKNANTRSRFLCMVKNLRRGVVCGNIKKNVIIGN